MKNLILTICLCLIVVFAFSQQTGDPTNDFYDNDSLYPLGIPMLRIEGEIANPGIFSPEGLQLHNLLVKEIELNDSGDTLFTGAYKYTGYSLYDILNLYEIKKNNFDEFNVITDLYVEVESKTGDITKFSWGEIYYPADPHRIIIATGVMRIVPSKTKEQWPLPQSSKVVAGNDLLTVRNISDPVKITVKTLPQSFTVTRHMEDMYSSEIKVTEGTEVQKTIKVFSKESSTVSCAAVFYGRGRGLHRIGSFEGFPLKTFFHPYIKNQKSTYKNGLVLFVAKDGYRAVFSMSEICNRNDFKDFLLIDRRDDKKNGAFSVFTAPDFFSDRAVKAITDILIIE